MKKFSLVNLTYKDVLIIKHALRIRVKTEEGIINKCNFSMLKVPPEEVEKYKKEHEEHKRCYKKVEEQVELIQDYINGKGSCRDNQLLL